MPASKMPCRSDQPSIKYRWSTDEGAFFEVGKLVPEEYAPSLPDKSRKSRTKSEAKQPEILSTAELIASLNQIWNCASRLAIFQQQANLDRNHFVSQKEDILVNLGREKNGTGSISADSKYFCVDLGTASQLPPVMKPNFEFVKITKKMSMFDFCNKNPKCSFYEGLLCCGTDLSNEPWKGKGLSAVGFSYKFGNVYKWMREMIPGGLKYYVNVQTENKKLSKYCNVGGASSDSGLCISADRTNPTDNLPTENAEPYSLCIKSIDSSILHDAKLVMDTRRTTSLCSDYFLTSVQETKANCSVSKTPDSNLCADYHINVLASCNSIYKECQHLSDGNECLKNEQKQPELFSTEDDSRMESHSTASEKPQFALAKQEHAFAGAFAGIFVSLCLHPVDTVKTVIQSCRAEQKSICFIGRSIISERGLTGLYRGIASNIASSAPISALYTFSYESVKEALLPLFPKEYHSLAHCLAGGCASIATSFIFTPSERVKQQMQVGVHYQNCWNALVGIVKKGGLPSLYTGWGAVLCRNVPHSIIKFYTYESLKQVMLTSLQSSAQPNTLQTLVCGGLAGSTAALFTTPFDVVKTRLQTQIPGSSSQYNSVYHALQDIRAQEGLKGLYRGLIPRLVMYVSQGALFFASYEFFKQLFSLEVPQFIIHKQHKENEDNSPSQLPSPLPSASASTARRSPSPSGLHSLHS
ncbi:mitochondrial aspartate-glutamate transporter AGC1 isoform X2 [Herrania umbratica]|uniref:Mitochondrial aspartate-glutamate transporter AGC1 isoform X2 n=1 Tax=Herrania umbratica TaxID=108875 RepID=A0A6J1B8E0_9ROSI|nr:mitochondrial aspartate-glutamate transporter AGC1 isoform X2 [Herrania umbratica]